jgi:hypothetical protein
MVFTRGARRARWAALISALSLVAGTGLFVLGAGSASGAQAKTGAAGYAAPARGELDCNGDSPVQKPLRAMNCTDIRGIQGVDNANTWGGKFYDNGVYIGHDEPDATFLSTQAGSGNDVTWTETLGSDPSAAPTDATPGRDVSHWFELSPAPWLSMAVCDSESYPLLPCTPQSDANAPACTGVACSPNVYPGAGSAFMEMQFYPPGNPPFVDSASCDDTHWCAALTIDSLECTLNFAVCNTTCEEPVNFAFIQTNGIPTGPPSPQLADLTTFTQNSRTLLMNPGDKVTVHMSDAPVPGGGGSAFKVTIDDLTLHTSGFMQASAKNGFQNTSIADCSGTPNNFEPEYASALKANIVPWAALPTNISTEFETGHFEPCTKLSDPLHPNPLDPSDTGGTYNECSGPYESAGPPDSGTAETGDGLCYKAGDTHPGFDGPGSSTPPDQATGCQDDFFQNGDLDFDGTPYWTEWPTGTTAGTYPASFVESLPTTTQGHGYPQYFFQSDIALSESTCTSTTLTGCTVPPSGPGGFYPYWSEVHTGGTCVLEFGNVKPSATVDAFGQAAQYGTDKFTTLGYPEFEGKVRDNTCA